MAGSIRASVRTPGFGRTERRCSTALIITAEGMGSMTGAALVGNVDSAVTPAIAARVVDLALPLALVRAPALAFGRVALTLVCFPNTIATTATPNTDAIAPIRRGDRTRQPLTRGRFDSSGSGVA